MYNGPCLLATIAVLMGFVDATVAGPSSRLRLVPFPKRVELQQGTFPLRDKLVLEVPAAAAQRLAATIGAELKRAGLPTPEIRPLEKQARALRLSAKPGRPLPVLPSRDRSTPQQEDVTPEDYWLEVRADEVACAAGGNAGVLYAVETFCQLIRANRCDEGLPCLTIRDWPSIRWRCFQDDLTRGPSSTLQTLKREVTLGAGLKMNLFTYYMEYQYAFKKHPIIGPKDGSLTPEDLAALVDYARRLHVEVLGNQQSFGHFEEILKHEQYAGLRETPEILCPVKQGSYRLLDDLYSEVCPILPFTMFNVCCDETWGLGTGPSKELAEKIGVGGVYVRHIRRIHDLLKDKYQKRMMIWGDIILQHPDQLEQIPKDTVMLTWGYGPQDSFDDQITPFARSGYEFFVCPGISNWSRILPDFDTATTNIRNFISDGAKHGALGVLNTAWEDDGEALQGYKWHGYAWGAECAWNASTTTPEDFNRRIGGVLFGEQGDHFGRAIELLAQTHRLPEMQGMNNSRFWQNDFPPRQNAATARTSAQRLLAIVRPAIEHLEACKTEATANADLLDYFLFGAKRMELIGQRMLDALKAAELYSQAYEVAAKDKEKAASLLVEAEKLVHTNGDAHEALGREFSRLWLAESKPYALDWTMQRYADVVKRYDDLAARLADARKKAEAGEPLPRPEELGLALPRK
jgi:hexosaminidase